MSIVIGLDVDDVCAELVRTTLQAYERIEGVCVPYESVTSWSFNPDVQKYFYKEWTYEDMPPVPGFIQGVKGLRNAGHGIVYISSCSRGTHDRKVRWLERHDPDFRWWDFIAASKKHLVTGVDVLVDDAPHNLEKMPESVKTVRFDRPWNQGIAANSHCVSWEGLPLSVDVALDSTERWVV